MILPLAKELRQLSNYERNPIAQLSQAFLLGILTVTLALLYCVTVCPFLMTYLLYDSFYILMKRYLCCCC